MDRALGDAWVEHVREAWVWMRDRWIPYPFQNNIWRLPEAELNACVDGLKALQSTRQSRSRRRRFANGCCDRLARASAMPSCSPTTARCGPTIRRRSNVQWMGERVATVNLPRILENIALKRDDVSWGPNSTFRFPLHGGTGAIWQSRAATVAGRAPAFRSCDRACRHAASAASKPRRARSIEYDALISTMPLDRLLMTIDGLDRHQSACAAIRAFVQPHRRHRP